MRQDKRYQAGYNLVELAIVLVVIGLIAGGTLKGLELVDNAKIKSVAHQLNDIRLAATLFSDRYGALPGDYDQASQTLQGDLKNGDGSGILTGNGLDFAASGQGHKAASFWTHLAAAKMIPDPGKPENGRMAFGRGAPKTRMGGGITIEHAPCPTCAGHWFIVGKENGTRGNNALFTPKQAQLLNQSLDNGNPTTGSVRSLEGAGIPPGQCVQNGQYNLETSKPTCIVMVQY